jgi:Flp pilus assembly protein TadG
MMRFGCRRGQSLLENALVLIVFATFLIGILDFGQYLYFHQSLVERARAAARYGAVNPTDKTGIQNVAVYNDPKGGTSPLLPNLTTAMIAVCLPGEASCADPGAGPDSRITVTISGYRMATFNLVIPRSFTNKPITASLPSEAPFS